MALADVDETLALLPAQVSADAAERAAIAAQWPDLLQLGPAVQSGLMEDLARPLGQRILGWGASILLSPAQAQAPQLDAEPQAFLARRVYADLRAGRLTLMDDREVGRCNAAGELVIAWCCTSPCRTSTWPTRKCTRSWPARKSPSACITPASTGRPSTWKTARRSTTCTARAASSRRFASEAALDGLPDPQRPVFMGLTRDEADRRLPGTTFAQLL